MRHQKGVYVSSGFDSFDRAYEPEVMYCNNISASAAVDSIATLNSAVTYCDNAQGTSSPTLTISADNLMVKGIDNRYDTVATVSTVNTLEDGLSKLTKALKQLADMSGMDIDADFNLKKKNEGVMKSQFSNRLKLGGGVQKLKKSALLTIQKGTF